MISIDDQQALRLISSIVPSISRNTIISEELSELQKLIDKEITEFLKVDAPLNSPEILFQFQYEFTKFIDHIKYNELREKNIVALGGSFSSGKSSFLNAFLRRRILPAEVEPTTSVPTYVIRGKTDKVNCVNLFGNKISLEAADLKVISHDFAEKYSIALGRLIHNIYIELPEHPYNNLAFLDTPGYSKYDADTYTVHTDEKIARAQLNSSNYIIWFTNVEEGTITESDIDFLRTIDKDIPKIIIINKADKKEQKDIEKIVKLVQNSVEQKKIPVEGVYPFSCRKPDLYPITPIENWLKRCDYNQIQTTFIKNFKLLFIECDKYFNDMIYREKKHRERLNAAILGIENDLIFNSLKEILEESDAIRKRFKEKSEFMKKLKFDFFTLLKKVGDIYHIGLPDPSEIDLIREIAPNPKKVVGDYLNKRNFS